MKRKLRPNVASWPDTIARPMRHVSDTKNCVSAREMAAPQLRSRDTWGPPLRAETHGAHPTTRALMSQSAKAGQLRRWDICHIILGFVSEVRFVPEVGELYQKSCRHKGAQCASFLYDAAPPSRQVVGICDHQPPAPTGSGHAPRLQFVHRLRTARPLAHLRDVVYGLNGRASIGHRGHPQRIGTRPYPRDELLVSMMLLPFLDSTHYYNYVPYRGNVAPLSCQGPDG